MADNAVETLYETADGLRREVPTGYLVLDKDGSSLVPADLNEEQFRRYLGQHFQRGPAVGDASWLQNEQFVGYCINQIFHTGANTTIILALDDIITYLATAANVPPRVGTDVESPTDNTSGVIWVVLNAIRHARGLKIPEESPNFS